MKKRSILELAVLALLAVTTFPCKLTLAEYVVAWGDKASRACEVPDGNDFIHIAGGGGAYGNHGLALKSDGSLVAWGYNGYGQCNVPTGNDFIDVAAGEFFSLALKSDGSLVAWGANTGYGWEYCGQCNVPPGNNFVDIACGSRHALAIRSDGSLAAWGMNDTGQCNVPAGNNYVAVAGGMLHSLALKADGSLIIWGSTHGWSRRLPSGNDFIAITAGAHHCLALKLDGSLIIWGKDSQGPNGQAWYVPDGNDFVAIASGRFHCLALTTDGTPVAWGENSYAQCNVPKGNKFTAIECGYELSLALKSEPPRKYYVDADANGAGNGSNWFDAFNYLQDALAVASYRDEILVAEGIYKPDQDSIHQDGTGDRAATFNLDNGVVIKGAYAGFGEPDPNFRDIKKYATILSGDFNDDDGPDFSHNSENSYHVVKFSFVDSSSVLDGFTITSGNANGEARETDSNSSGAGIQCIKSGPLIINCTINRNSAEGSFSNGGGIYNYGTNFTPSPTIINCVISGNRARNRGGAMYNNNYSVPILINCTICSNSAGDGSGLSNLNASNPLLINCILWNNGEEIWNGSHCTTTITYSDVQGGWLGEGNIDADPCFIDPDNGDYHLRKDSPCIDAGEDAGVYTDIEGNIRPIDFPGIDNNGELPEFDMGVYEAVITNTSPVAYIADGNQVIEAQGPFGAKVTLDGSCSSDSDSTPGTNDDILYFDWYQQVDPCDPNTDIFLGSGQIIDCNLPLGEHTIILEVIDKADASDSNEVTIIVQDTTPPVISCPEDITLYAPSPAGAVATFTVAAADLCDPAPEIICDPPSDSMFPVGTTEVICTATDASGNSASCSFTVTVVEPLEAWFRILPRVINRSSRRQRILALIRLPENVTKDQIDSNTPLILIPGDIESIYQRIIRYNRRGSPHTIIFALFSKDQLMSAVPDNGRVELEVIGNLTTGQYFYGTDTVWIRSRRWLPWRHR